MSILLANVLPKTYTTSVIIEQYKISLLSADACIIIDFGPEYKLTIRRKNNG